MEQNTTHVVDDDNKVDIQYIKLSGITTDNIFQDLEDEMDSAMDVADLVVFNVGLHLLHLIGNGGRHALPAAYQAWIHYEYIIKDFIKLAR